MTFDYWLINAVGLVLALVLLVRLQQRTNDIISFVNLFSIGWGANLLVSQFVFSPLSRPGIGTTVVLYASWCVFLLVSLVVLSRPVASTEREVKYSQTASLMVLTLFIGLQWIAVLFEIREQGQTVFEYYRILVGQSSVLRLSGSLQELDLPAYLEIWRWGYAVYLPLAFILHQKKRLPLPALVGILILALLSASLRVTRAPLLHIVIIGLICWVILYRPASRKVLLISAVLLVSLVIAFVALQGSLLSTDETLEAPIVSESLLSYVGGPAKAYDLLLRGYFPESGQFYSLDAVMFVLEKLELIDTRPDIIRPYVFTPYPTNVYTFLDAFTLDLGVQGAVVGSALVAAIVAWFYKRARADPRLYNLAAYTSLAYACAMASLNNEFIRFSIPLTLILAGLAGGIVTVNISTRRRRFRSGAEQMVVRNRAQE